jgi:hypothetical protein
MEDAQIIQMCAVMKMRGMVESCVKELEEGHCEEVE